MILQRILGDGGSLGYGAAQAPAARLRPGGEAASGLDFTVDERRHQMLSLARRTRSRMAGKRALDLVLAGAALVFLMPLLIAVAAIIRVTSPGPILFVQGRVGKNGLVFPMLKFRTMHLAQCDPSGVSQTVPGDSRVTPFGVWLRRTSIDELPQLLNVVLGHMSLVGPRPHPVGMMAAGRPYDQLVPYYRLRQDMQPGLSGWAQVNGYRGPTTDRVGAIARIDHDLAYLQNFSIFLDILIIIETLRKELTTGTGM